MRWITLKDAGCIQGIHQRIDRDFYNGAVRMRSSMEFIELTASPAGVAISREEGAQLFLDPVLEPVYEKVIRRERLSADDGLTLYRSDNLLGIGFLANLVRERINGQDAYYIYNQHINYTNICRNGCSFCAFSRKDGEQGAYTMSLDEIAEKVRSRLNEPITEVHIVGGLNEELPYSYYLDMLSTIKRIRPAVHIQAFTAVEIAWLAEISGQTPAETLLELREAGLGSLPGGGAEVFSPRVRQLVCPKKLPAHGWLEIMRTAHRLGIRSNATMLYGHVETLEERVDHLLALRNLQDEYAGFLTFIPLAFHPHNTRLSSLKKTSGFDDLKNIAIARLLLDNFVHIKPFWIMVTPKIAQIALSFGADDMDGTVIEERITHMAGGETAQGLPQSYLISLIQEAGRCPRQRDTLYNLIENGIGNTREHDTALPRNGGAARRADADTLKSITDKVLEDTRISPEEAAILFREADLLTLGSLAHVRRQRMHPDNLVTYIVDRNINYTNICLSKCRFCAFFREEGAEGGYVISREELARKIEETLELGGIQILMQGGLHPRLMLDYYEDLLGFIKSRYRIHIHGFSPPEIIHFSRLNNLPVQTVLERLRACGLDSIPGGGAEILVDRVRREVSPCKCTCREWLEVMETAHRIGLKTTATMMFGHIETLEERIEHLFLIRQLQDKTKGFTAFIPWPFQPGNTSLISGPAASGFEYLKTLAISRIFLDNVPNIQASWVTQGAKVAQIALRFGANDLGSTMIEENVVAAAGVSHRLPESELIRIIEGAGFQPNRRTMDYALL
ncbi:MAG: cyclic dehypoxanthinyl futalosine synthase [bacterium]